MATTKAGASSALRTLSNDLAAATERAGKSVVAVHARRRIPSSGVHWKRGVIVAAHHTIRKDDDITVTLGDGSTVPATLKGRDPGTDLAVLTIDENASGAAVADVASDTLAVGQVVLALGRPGPSVTASLGIVSALGGEFRTWHGGTIDQLVRLDLAVYDGFSGGALADADGRVLGINTSGLSRGAALAIPARTVERVAAQLLERGSVKRGFLGVGMQAVRLPESIATRLTPRTDVGLIVVGIAPGGPAERAGVQLGDVIVALDGTAVRDPDDVLAMLGADRVGKAIAATIVRGGEVRTVDITVGER